MRARAAILVQTAQPLEIVDLEIGKPASGQALVRLARSGVCRTQVLEWQGLKGPDRFLPHCLGHEGSGTVVEVGPGVTRVRAGDRVVLSWMKAGGADVPGSTYGWGERRVNAGGLTTFNEAALVSENRMTRLPEGLTLDEGAFLGCAAATGLGAVLNVLRPRRGESLAVFGVGGIGLCAVAAAASAGCAPVIAVDVRADALRLARELGAQDTVDASAADVASAISKLCPGGIDHAVEASGRTEVMAQALAAVRPRGGTVVVVGNAPHGERMSLDPGQLNQGKRLLGTWGGDNEPDRDFTRWAALIREGRLPLARLVSGRYRLDDVNRALDDLASGRATRPMVDLEG
jgi:S-(hydroxymethyl)glutathione dehydrogenase / alcohol dehydrogenase